MTTPGSADQVIFNQLNGGAPGAWAYYQLVRARARVVYGGLDNNQPFQFPMGAGGAKVAATPATMDAVTSASEQISWRHVDPYGNVMDPHKLWMVQWYWFLDGCPTPLTQKRLGDYIKFASQLRPWPSGFKGAMPGDPTATYAAFPPATPTPLDAAATNAPVSLEEEPELPNPPMEERFADPPGWGGGGHGGPGGDHGPGGWGGHGGDGPHGPGGWGGGPHGPGGWGGGGHRGWGDHDDHGWHRGWGEHGYGPGWGYDYPPPWWWWLTHVPAPASQSVAPAGWPGNQPYPNFPPPPWRGPVI